ncbi:MAG: PEGA domain-containing protein [Patescibacteria group bacterium]
MSPKKRRLFYLSLILIFLVAGPLIIFRALGYNFKLFERKIVKTGLFYVSSKPENADIYLDGLLTKKRTPTRLSNLKPGEYLLTLKKTGYQSWQKKLNIFAHYTTFADQVVLFKNNPKKDLLISEKILFAKSSTSSSQIAVITESNGIKSLKIINPVNKTIKIIEENIEEEIIDLNWGENKFLVARILEQGKNDLMLFDLIKGVKTKFSSFTIQIFNNLIVSHSNIYGLSGDLIYRIDPYNKKIQALNQKPARDFIVKNNYLYYLTSEEKTTELIRLDLAKNEERFINIYNDITHNFLTLESENLFIVKDNQSFCIFSVNQENQNTCFNHAISQSLLSPNQKKLLYNNEHEIFTYDLTKDEENLITRQSKNIDQVYWYPNSEYIIYNSDQSIKAIECDLRGTINSNLLYSEKAEILNLPSAKEITLLIQNGQNKSDDLINLIIL